MVIRRGQAGVIPARGGITGGKSKVRKMADSFKLLLACCTTVTTKAKLVYGTVLGVHAECRDGVCSPGRQVCRSMAPLSKVRYTCFGVP